MKHELMKRYKTSELDFRTAGADHKIHSNGEYETALPASSLFYSISDDMLIHVPNPESILGLNLDMAV